MGKGGEGSDELVRGGKGRAGRSPLSAGQDRTLETQTRTRKWSRARWACVCGKRGGKRDRNSLPAQVKRGGVEGRSQRVLE